MRRKFFILDIFERMNSSLTSSLDDSKKLKQKIQDSMSLSSSSLDLYCPTPETQRSFVNIDENDLRQIGMGEEDIPNFLNLREQYLTKTAVDWESVYSPANDFFMETYDNLPIPNLEEKKELLNKVVLIYLNGGISKMDNKSPRGSLSLKKEGNPISILECKLMQLDVSF